MRIFLQGGSGVFFRGNPEVYMRKWLLGSTMWVVALSAQARQGGDFGLGFQLGEPVALSAKYWMGESNALDMALGFRVFKNDHVYLRCDYLWHVFDLIPVQRGRLPLFYGMGVMAKISDNAGVGIKGVVGLAYLFDAAPLDAFVQVGPGAYLIPEPDGLVDVGIGMRYYF